MTDQPHYYFQFDNLSNQNKPQPAPVQNDNKPLWDIVQGDLIRSELLSKLILEDMRERDAMGTQTYGTQLRAHNGRDAIVDAYQEALDCLVYLKQAQEEGVENVDSEYYSIMTVVRTLRLLIEARKNNQRS